MVEKTADWTAQLKVFPTAAQSDAKWVVSKVELADELKALRKELIRAANSGALKAGQTVSTKALSKDVRGAAARVGRWDAHWAGWKADETVSH